MKKKNNTVRISKLVISCVIFSFVAILAKLSIIIFKTEIDGLNLSKFAANRNTAKKTLYAPRGSIYDANGNLLAKSVNSYTVIAYLDVSRTTNPDNPQHVIDKAYTAAQLAPLLNMTEEYILSLLNKKLYQVELGPNGRNITELAKEAIEALDLPGIDFIASAKRTYQMGNFASYIVGYARADDQGKMAGEMGIEAYYEDQLKGTNGYIEYQQDNYGYQIPNTRSYEVPAVKGKDIYLTIDSDIQMLLENAMNTISSAASMSWGTISIIDGKTGAILGSTSNPSFNPNDLNIASYLNPLVAYQYEPGSTMKIFSFLAAMENGLYNGSDTYQSGTIVVADAVIQDFNAGKGWGTITFDEGFARSSNVAATTLSLKLGGEKLSAFYKKAGFGSKTGITLPGEVSGAVSFKYKTEIATASFGQGLATTPIQTLQAATILTNDGIMVKPYIVQKIVDSETNKAIYTSTRTELGRVASSANIKKMQSLMKDVVEQNYTDAHYYLPSNVELMGKTGTSQISDPNGGYLTGKNDYIRSFIGVFPADDPQYIVYLSFKQYTGAYSTIAKSIKSVIEEIAKNKNLTNNNQGTNESSIITLSSYLSQDTQKSVKMLENIKVKPIVLGSGTTIVNQYPKAGTAIVTGTKVYLITNENDYQMPNIIGWSANEITTFCKLIDLDYKITGYGSVLESSIPEGTVIDKNSLLLITLAKK